MANRRMFSRDITESDAFCSMPMSAQCLYFHFGMLSDDDGVVNSPRRIQRSIGASEDDLKILIAKKFVLVLDDEEGLLVIKHWKINNYIQKDRYVRSKYADKLLELELDENNAYRFHCIQDVYTLDTQDRLGKDSIGKSNNDKLIKNDKQAREQELAAFESPFSSREEVATLIRKKIEPQVISEIKNRFLTKDLTDEEFEKINNQVIAYTIRNTNKNIEKMLVKNKEKYFLKAYLINLEKVCKNYEPKEDAQSSDLEIEVDIADILGDEI